jgi:glycosyltransferase involved in cell wall biosynthesis
MRQTVAPDEIVVLDDGSTDNTVSILESYGPKINVVRQKNQGVAVARNALSKLARGNLAAFLDHDDLWHPNYLEVQRTLFEQYPQCVGFFTGHVDFYGYGDYDWDRIPNDMQFDVDLIDPLSFFQRYNRTTGPFGSMSYCCIPKQVLNRIGCSPFCVNGVDDSYLCSLLALLGPVVYVPMPLVAYRITNEAQSTNKLKALKLWVKVFELLQERYRNQPDRKLFEAFTIAFASKRRQYAKLLLKAGRTVEARRQFRYSLRSATSKAEMAKSLAWLFVTFMPDRFQPKLAPSYRMGQALDVDLRGPRG